MSRQWKYSAELPGGMRHSVQVQTDTAGVDFNLLVFGHDGGLLAADRGPEAGAECTIDVLQRSQFVFVVELIGGSGRFSLQVSSQPLDEGGERSGSTGRAAPARVPTPTAGAQPASALTVVEAEAMIVAHNRWRAQVGVPPVTWSQGLAEHAQQWADELGRTGMQIRHRSPNEFGENLYWCDGQAASPDEVVDAWGNEQALYEYAANNWWPDAGHFSQLVWRSTTEVGAGVVRRGGTEIWVCNYSPRGNWTGKRPY